MPIACSRKEKKVKENATQVDGNIKSCRVCPSAPD